MIKSQFLLRCRTDDNLIMNVVYRADISIRNDNKYPLIYWYHPVNNVWINIGYHNLSNFDITPIKKYINRKKSKQL